jgi:hypothetical protein
VGKKVILKSEEKLKTCVAVSFSSFFEMLDSAINLAKVSLPAVLYFLS